MPTVSAVVVMVAMPLLMLPEPMADPPFMKVMDPAGVPPVLVTVAVKVTGLVAMAVDALLLRTMLEVARTMLCGTEPEVLLR